MSTTICIYIVDQAHIPGHQTYELSDYDQHNTLLRDFLVNACASVGCDSELYCLIHNNNVIGKNATLATLAYTGETLVNFYAIRLIQPTSAVEELYGNSAMSLQSTRDIEIIMMVLSHECLYIFAEHQIQSTLTAITNTVIQLEKREGRDTYASMTSLARMTLLIAKLSPAFPQVPLLAWEAILKVSS